MSDKVIKLTKVSSGLNREFCKQQLINMGFLHQDTCELCQFRVEMAWAVIVNLNKITQKNAPKLYKITHDDLRDILTTALFNFDGSSFPFTSKTT